jgi:hypothetical protein
MPEKLRRLLRVILYPILFLIGSLVHAIVLFQILDFERMISWIC